MIRRHNKRISVQFILSDRITDTSGERPSRSFFQLGLWREPICLSAPSGLPSSKGLDPSDRLGPLLRAGLPWMNASSPGERSRAGWDRWDGCASRASGTSTCVAASTCRRRVGRRHCTTSQCRGRVTRCRPAGAASPGPNKYNTDSTHIK